MAEKVFLNNKLVNIDKASISVTDSGFLYGAGLFETMRSYNGVVFSLKDHLDRLFFSAGALSINNTYSREYITDAIYNVLKAKLFNMQVAEFKYPEMISPDVYHHLYISLKQYLDYVRKTLEMNINRFDKFYIHIKETDVPGHDGLALHKKKMIEIVDERLFSFLRKLNVKVCITSDHSTPCSIKNHSSDPVPVVIYGNGKDKVGKFDEISAKAGELGTIRGVELMKILEK